LLKDGNNLRLVGDLAKKASVVSAAIENEPMALQFAFDEAFQNKDLVLKAVQKKGSVLQFAHEWKND